jgi:hypothetical protein
MKYDAENPGLGQEQEKYDIIIYYLNKLFDFIFLLMAGFLPDIQSGSFLSILKDRIFQDLMGGGLL